MCSWQLLIYWTGPFIQVCLSLAKYLASFPVSNAVVATGHTVNKRHWLRDTVLVFCCSVVQQITPNELNQHSFIILHFYRSADWAGLSWSSAQVLMRLQSRYWPELPSHWRIWVLLQAPWLLAGISSLQLWNSCSLLFWGQKERVQGTPWCSCKELIL